MLYLWYRYLTAPYRHFEIFKKVQQKLIFIFGLIAYFSNNPYGTHCTTTLLTDDADKL